MLNQAHRRMDPIQPRIPPRMLPAPKRAKPLCRCGTGMYVNTCNVGPVYTYYVGPVYIYKHMMWDRLFSQQRCPQRTKPLCRCGAGVYICTCDVGPVCTCMHMMWDQYDIHVGPV